MRNKSGIIPVKKNQSSTQVMKTLQVLMQGDYSMQELIQKLNEKEKVPVFNNSVVSKYINTCRYCGIQIPKIYNKYFVLYIPFCINITENDDELLMYLQEFANEALSARANKEFLRIIAKFNHYSNKKISRVEENTKSIVCDIFEEAVNCKHKILLMLKNKTEQECIPLNIEEHNGKLFFHVICDDEEQMIGMNRVAKLQILKDRFVPVKNEGNVVFVLTGNLANNYNTREHETMLRNNLPESVTIVNHGENNILLLSRLLRYGDLCELKGPFKLRNEMKTIIDETLANYGE